MKSPVAQSTSSPGSIDFSSLSPEILLSIFLSLSSEEIVIFRRISKTWLKVIETNKSLWRNLEWIGKSGKSVEKAVEMFDQKSSSSLEMVSIEDKGTLNSKDLQQSIAVVSRSEASLKSLSVLTSKPHVIFGQLLEQASSSPKLERLILWDSNKEYKWSLPLTHLVPKGKRIEVDSSASCLKGLWLDSTSQDIEELLRLPDLLFKSLISFALYGTRSFRECQTFLTKFSESIVHLRLSITDGGSQMEQPFFCPNLKILEGNFHPGVSLYFDCPNLKHLIFSFVLGSKLHGMPSSVEQLWLKSNAQNFTAGFLEPLLSSCPRMGVLKLRKLAPRSESRGSINLQPEALIQVLEKRQEIIDKGEEIQGLQVVPLQKLVLPLTLISEDQLKRARKVVEEVVDIQDYPDFVELEY